MRIILFLAPKSAQSSIFFTFPASPGPLLGCISASKFQDKKLFLKQNQHATEQLARFLKISTFVISKMVFFKISTSLKSKHKVITLATILFRYIK